MRAEAIREFLVDLSGHFEREFIVIGGWADHAYGAKNYSLDGDAMISYEVQGTLRDSYEVTKNARMHKEQFRCPTGDDIDLYVERQHRLPVPFAELQAYCRLQAGMWVACPEHLLILKLGAWRDRGHTPKGQKDRQDMINLLDRARTEFRHPELLAERLTAPDWEDPEAQAVVGDNQSVMILNRVHQPLHSVTLAELCREAGWVCPIQTDWPLRVELTPSEGAAGPHWRNHPGGSYSTGLSDAAAIIEMLAYEAHEWQAWEVARERRRGGSYRFALLT